MLAIPLVPLYQLAVGEITKRKLDQLDDMEHPMLRQISSKSPGTWQHSLAMANMAQQAASAIGANGRLVRVETHAIVFHDGGDPFLAALQDDAHGFGAGMFERVVQRFAESERTVSRHADSDHPNGNLVLLIPRVESKPDFFSRTHQRPPHEFIHSDPGPPLSLISKQL